MRKNYFSQLLNVHKVSDVRQVKTHTTEPLLPARGSFEVEIAIAKLKRHKSPGSDELRQNSFKQEVKYYVLRPISKDIPVPGRGGP
jgi:hypothetical protein